MNFAKTEREKQLDFNEWFMYGGKKKILETLEFEPLPEKLVNEIAELVYFAGYIQGRVDGYDQKTDEVTYDEN